MPERMKCSIFFYTRNFESFFKDFLSSSCRKLSTTFACKYKIIFCFSCNKIGEIAYEFFWKYADSIFLSFRLFNMKSKFFKIQILYLEIDAFAHPKSRPISKG